MDSSVSAADLFARLRRAYGDLESYSDEGEQTNRRTRSGSDHPSRWTTVQRYRTRWRRPAWLYFASERVMAFEGVGQHSSLSVICSTPNGTRQWASYSSGSKRAKSLESALYAFKGTCGGVTWFVPPLLAGLASSLDDMGSATQVLAEHRDLDGAACLVASSGSESHSLRQIWVDAATDLLVRVDSVGHVRRSLSKEAYQARLRSLLAGDLDDQLPPDQVAELIDEIRPLAANPNSRDFTTESTTRYRPVINPVLDDSHFEFTPPSA